MREQNAYKRHQAYLDRITIIRRGMIWVATKTMLIIENPHGWTIFDLRKEPK